jgi:hypothetical protein
MIAYHWDPDDEREQPPARVTSPVGQVGEQFRDDAELALYHRCAQPSLRILT